MVYIQSSPTRNAVSSDLDILKTQKGFSEANCLKVVVKVSGLEALFIVFHASDDQVLISRLGESQFRLDRSLLEKIVRTLAVTVDAVTDGIMEDWCDDFAWKIRSPQDKRPFDTLARMLGNVPLWPA